MIIKFMEFIFGLLLITGFLKDVFFFYCLSAMNIYCNLKVNRNIFRGKHICILLYKLAVECRYEESNIVQKNKFSCEMLNLLCRKLDSVSECVKQYVLHIAIYQQIICIAYYNILANNMYCILQLYYQIICIAYYNILANNLYCILNTY